MNIIKRNHISTHNPKQKAPKTKIQFYSVENCAERERNCICILNSASTRYLTIQKKTLKENFYRFHIFHVYTRCYITILSLNAKNVCLCDSIIHRTIFILHYINRKTNNNFIPSSCLLYSVYVYQEVYAKPKIP